MRRKQIIKYILLILTLIIVSNLLILFSYSLKKSIDNNKIILTIPEYEYQYMPEYKLTTPETQITKVSLGKYTITAYCSCEKCCGKWAQNRPNGKVIGSAGIELTPEVSVASPLPFGTILEIDGNNYIVEDRTSEAIAKRYNNKIIDIYFDSHQKALNYGKKSMEVFKIVDI